MFIKSLIFLFITMASLSYAEVYQHMDAQGHITYSDSPLNSDAKKMVLPGINQTGSQTPTPAASDKTPKIVTDEVRVPYQSFSIASPKNEETIQNQPVFPVQINIEPKLQEGDMIQLVVDGKPMGPPQPKTVFELANVDRGSHQISAYVINKNQEVLNRSNPVTVYVHHASIFSIQRTGGQAPTAPKAPTAIPAP